MLVLVTSVAGAQTDPLRDTCEARSRAFFTASRTQGLAVGVMKDGKLVFAGGFGTLEAGSPKPVTARTVFHMASISKTFVATAVMQLVEQGTVKLDDYITKYIPSLQFRNSRDANVSVRQILTHTAGIPDVTDYAWDNPEYDDGALERWVRGLADSTLRFPPGTQWRYSNIGFEILAHLVAVVSGETFEGYVQKHILTPAGMSHSTFLMTDVDSANLAAGHQMVRGVQAKQNYPYNRRHAGSSTMHSNVEDMLRYATFQMNRGSIDGKQVLTPASYDLMWKGQRDLTAMAADEIAESRRTSTKPLTKVEMGLGWLIFNFSGIEVMNHDGGDRGFRSTLLIAPDQRTAVVVFANSGADVSDLGFTLLRNALGIAAAQKPTTYRLN